MTKRLKSYSLLAFALLFITTRYEARAETLSPLYARGYTVLPVPQKVTLGARDFRFSSGWQLELGAGVQRDNVAVEALQEDLESRHHFTLANSGSQGAGIIALSIQPGSVAASEIGAHHQQSLLPQAYRIKLAPTRVEITANASAGLFYGVETLVQLLKRQSESLWLPEGEIVDWPDLEMRIIYWDDAHHLEHLDALKQALRQAAFFKINGFALKLEGHFQYRSAAPIVEPYALTPTDLQELTDYARRYHIELIPYLDAPAHVAFILKHPEYAALREYANSNYELCVTNPGSYQLLNGMYQDLLDANKGGKYFVLSTDEPYYIGMAKDAQCNEASRAGELGSVGKLLAEFLTKAAGYLHDRGRTVIFWGEYPLKPDDIASLPSYLVNGEVYGPQFDPAFKARGIRQMVYTSTEGEEPIFPNYYLLPKTALLHPGPRGAGRVREMFDSISQTSLRRLSSVQPDHPAAGQADVMGTFVAGWADAGLHPETFWLGYATASAAAWHRVSPGPDELMGSFYALFYGPSATHMGRAYQLLSGQAEFWEDSWDRMDSSARTPIWGNSYRIFDPPHPAYDQTLPSLPVPSAAQLAPPFDWSNQNARRLELAATRLAENDELLDLLHENLGRVELNQHNLEVFLSLAQLCRQNLFMILELGHADELLKAAQAAAKRGDAAAAVASVDQALDLVESIRRQRNRVLDDATATWYKTWFPRVAEANDRRYLDQVDDVKDHRPVRTVDMSYLVYREKQWTLGDWAAQTSSARNEYARTHNLPAREAKIDWKATADLN